MFDFSENLCIFLINFYNNNFHYRDILSFIDQILLYNLYSNSSLSFFIILSLLYGCILFGIILLLLLFSRVFLKHVFT